MRWLKGMPGSFCLVPLLAAIWLYFAVIENGNSKGPGLDDLLEINVRMTRQEIEERLGNPQDEVVIATDPANRIRTECYWYGQDSTLVVGLDRVGICRACSVQPGQVGPSLWERIVSRFGTR